MNAKNLLTLVAVSAIAVGCANNQHTVLVKPKAKYDYKNPDINVTNHFFIAGILQEDQVQASGQCRAAGFGDPKVVITEQRWYQSLISVLTWGLYSPKKTYVWCEETK